MDGPDSLPLTPAMDELSSNGPVNDPSPGSPVDKLSSPLLDEPHSDASFMENPALDTAPVDDLTPKATPSPADMMSLPPSPLSAGSPSMSSLSSDSSIEEPVPSGRVSQVRWADAVSARHRVSRTVHSPEQSAQSSEPSELADPLVYDATRATVGAVLGHAADLLQQSARSTAAGLVRHVLAVVRDQLEVASASVHRLLPLGVRLAEHVMTVSQWRAVEARSRQYAQHAIYRALLELQLSEERQQARRLLRALRRRPARLWADVSLEEAAAELTAGRPADHHFTSDPAGDAGREAAAALLAAYRAAARARLTEPVPSVPLPPAAGLDAAGRLAAVHDVVRSWRYSIRWRYCVDFLRCEEEPLVSRYIYQARFSVPEQHQPIPRPVAYVFFVLTVPKAKRASEPIEMYYMIETSRLRHVPSQVIFQEKWLIDVINVKLKFWREIKF